MNSGIWKVEPQSLISGLGIEEQGGERNQKWFLAAWPERMGEWWCFWLGKGRWGRESTGAEPKVVQRGEDIFFSCAMFELTIRRPGGVRGRLSQLILGMWVWSLGELRTGLINLNIEMVLIAMKWYRHSFPLFWHRTQWHSQPHQVAESREQEQEDLMSCCHHYHHHHH